MSLTIDTEADRLPGYTELKQLANWIERDSDGKVCAYLDHSIITNVARISIKIMSSGSGKGSYDLLQVRALDLAYPVVLEVTHFDDEHRISKRADPTALLDSLESVLRDERTKKIIQLFADEAVAPIKTSEPRPFFVPDKPFKHQGKLMTHVAFLGFGGFLSLETMQRLAMEPDSKGAAVQTFGDKYVATFSFEDDVKVTLSQEELQALQRNARLIVDGTD